MEINGDSASDFFDRKFRKWLLFSDDVRKDILLYYKIIQIFKPIEY